MMAPFSFHRTNREFRRTSTLMPSSLDDTGNGLFTDSTVELAMSGR